MIDIDECTEGIDECSDICKNTNGAFECSCKDGYKLAADKKNCTGKVNTYTL